MYANVGLVTGDHNDNFYDITHSFKIDSNTYHVLGLRKDRPNYRNTYYIFNCPGCEEQQHDFVSSAHKFLPHIHTPRVKTPRPSSERISIERSLAEIMEIEHRTLIKSIRKSVKKENEKLVQSLQESPPKKVDQKASLNEQKIREILKTQHESIRKSFCQELKIENQSLIQLVKESSATIDKEKSITEEKLNEILKSEHELMIESFRQEIRSEREALFKSIESREQSLKEELSQLIIKKEELIRLFEEQKQSLESIYERQINTIDTHTKSITENTTILDVDQKKSSSTLNQFQITLIQNVDKEVQRIISKTIEKIELMTVKITELKTDSKPKIDDTDFLNYLFTEQKKILNEIIREQEIIWNERLNLIIREVFHEVSQNPNSTHTTNGLTSNNTNSNIQRTVSNSADEHLLKLSIQSPEPVRLLAKLIIDGVEYPAKSHTLCQSDPIHSDKVTCYLAPPAIDGPYNLVIYAKTKTETAYRAAISVRFPGVNVPKSIYFPYTFPSFENHQCILIEPLRSSLKHNELSLIHMIVPDARDIKIQNGDQVILLDHNEYNDRVVKKQIKVLGDVHVYGRWKNENDEPICFFYVV